MIRARLLLLFTSPAEDLDTIATYLGSYLSELKNPSFYSYSLDGSSYYVNDGGGDMYDMGNYTQPWFISNTNNTTNGGTSSLSGDLNYSQTTSTTVDTDFKYETSCQCFTDACNTASSISYKVFYQIVISFVAVLGVTKLYCSS